MRQHTQAVSTIMAQYEAIWAHALGSWLGHTVLSHLHAAEVFGRQRVLSSQHLDGVQKSSMLAWIGAGLPVTPLKAACAATLTAMRATMRQTMRYCGLLISARGALVPEHMFTFGRLRCMKTLVSTSWGWCASVRARLTDCSSI